MRRLRALVLRMAGVFGAGRRDRDIDNELRAHRELLADEYARSGLTPEAARRRAAADFGSVATAAESYRDRRGLRSLESLARDGRMALRSLARAPMLSVSMILVLGLGIGLSTAMVAVYYAVVWDTLPVAAPERVVRMTQQFSGKVDRRVQGHPSLFSYPELQTYRSRTHTLSAVAGSLDATMGWRHEKDARLLHGVLVAGDYFKVLAITPSLGRALVSDDATRPVIVIGHRFWTSAFAADPGVIGQTMWLDGSAYTIVGIGPESFSFSDSDQPVASFWLPLEAAYQAQGREAFLQEANASWLQVMGRLDDQASVSAAQSEAAVVAAEFDRSYPGRRTTIAISRASRVDRQAFRSAILTLGAIVTASLGLLLLICGSNAAALLLARGAARQKEIAVRIALGAGRGHIVRQLAAEVVLIASASALVGVGVCVGALHQTAAFVPMGDLLSSIQPDARVFGFAFAAAFVVAFAFGLAPARQALRVDCLANLKGDRSTTGGLTGMRLRRALIAVQVAVCLPLLVVAALIGRSVSQASVVDPGYAIKGLYAIDPQVSSAMPGYPGDPSLRVGGDLADRLKATPGIHAAGRALVAPFFGTGIGRASADASKPLESTHFNVVDDAFFRTLGVPIVAGRSFAPGETGVVIVNAKLARGFWGNEQAALGQALYVPIPLSKSPSPQPMRVVGVTPTLQTTTIGVPDDPTYYLPLDAGMVGHAFVLVRADETVPVERLVVAELRSIAPAALATVTALDARLANSTRPAQVVLLVAGSIGLLALMVAAVGVHGVISHTVASRSRDLGIYQALGATPRQVLVLILGWTLRGVAIGAAAAIAIVAVAGLVFSGPLRTAFSGLSLLDAPSFAIGLTVLAVAIGAAAYLPVRRAVTMTPLSALRHD
ncbi:MAG: ABC transporter permease [Vicinamibacterales bacterium]